MTDDRTPTDSDRDRQDAVTVAEAAQRLGVSHDAIRARLRRGTIDGEKRGDEWIVFLPAEGHDGQQDTDTSPTGDDRPAVALVDQLREEVAYLRSELTAARIQAAQERERADILQREALQRIEALTAGSVARQDTRQDATGEPESVDTVPPDAEPLPPATSLWSRLWHALKGS